MLELSFGNMNVRLNVFHASNQPSTDDDFYMIDFRVVLEDDYAMLWGGDELISCKDGSDIFEVNNSITDLEELLHCPPSPGEERVEGESYD